MSSASPHPIPVAILGATGYAGEGALKLLLGHPHFTVVHAGSDRLAGTPVATAVPGFAQETELILGADTAAAILASGAKAVVLAKKSVEVTQVVPELLAAGLKLVDIGAEFRLRAVADYKRWYKEDHASPEVLPEAVYGLTEWYTDAIRTARVVGNPGCYATSVLLPLLPLVHAGVIDLQVPIVAVGYSGLSGAGKRHVEATNNLFWAMNENLRSYKQVGHQHTGEVDQELSVAAKGPCHVTFIPHLAPITRGIHTTITARLKPGHDANAVTKLWQDTYAGRPFVRVRATPKDVELAHVQQTNFCDFAATQDGDTLIITSVLDNLVKGASGQAIQNLNVMFGLPETAGLLHRSC